MLQKTAIYKQTWQHPKSKQWHCIDYVITRQKDRKWCLDIEVKRGADCNIDHQLLRGKIAMGRRWYRRGKGATNKRYAISQLSDSNDGAETKELFAETVAAAVAENRNDKSPLEDKWNKVRGALTDAADSVLGYEKHRNPDWFRESLELLEPLLQRRNQLYTKWLGSKSDCDKLRYCEARRVARRAVRTAKNTWFQNKANEAQSVRFRGKKVWQCIRDMQRAHRGLIPTRSAMIRSEDGTPCTTTKAQHQRWRDHFSILNTCSHYSPAELEKVNQRPVADSMGNLPTMEEMMQAVKKLKPGKAGGSSGVLPEMVRASCTEDKFRVTLLELLHCAWKEERVPRDWANALLVPIPKKGDLTLCDNWRGIALLDVVGKVMARVVQGRLQQLAENVLPESQCGFRRGRGCTDLIFTVGQLIEKSNEHRAKVFLIFIDLCKAYDSIPREALWTALAKPGIPDSLLGIIRAFHQGMKAAVRIDKTLLEEFDVNNGLRQGCCMAPALFNLYACLVTERWPARMVGSKDRGRGGGGLCSYAAQARWKTLPEIPQKCMRVLPHRMPVC